MTRKAAIFVVIMSLVIVSLSGCSDVPVQEQPPTKVETPVKGGILNLGTTLPIQTLNPVISGESNGELTNLLFNGLIKVDKNLSYRSDLAESWHVSENGLEWTLKLRSDVKWHDGMPVTADDIIFTLDYALDTRVKSPWAQELSNIARYEQPDASTIMFELYQPDSAFLYTMRIKILPKHVFQGQDILTFDFNQNPVGTGPFKFKNWDLTTNTIELIANEKYFGNSPYISDIKFKIFESEDEQESAFKSGKLDAMPISVENWSIYQEMKDVATYEFPSLSYEFVAINLRETLFSQKTVRQAMMYGIQREKILNEVIFGRGHIVNGPIPTNSWAYNTDIEDYKYNPEKAKQLLADAGWQDSDGDGIIEKDGNKFSLNILVNEENYQRFEITKQVEQDLSNLGIDAKVLVKPWSEVKKLVNTGRYQAATLGWQLKPDPDVTFAFHSKEIKSGFNFVGYSNPKIDELSVKTRRINDITQQRNNLLEIQKIINDDVPYLFLYSKNDLLAVNRKVKGINPGPNGLYYGIESWWISGEEQ